MNGNTIDWLRVIGYFGSAVVLVLLGLAAVVPSFNHGPVQQLIAVGIGLVGVFVPSLGQQLRRLRGEE